ncbi:MAG: hypothetical protein U0790_00920 [Isosphaeraceae bacterium]
MAPGPIGKAILALGILLPAASIADDRPADRLLDLLPPDAGLTLTIEGLRDGAADFLASPAADRLMDLPAARAWLASDQFRKLAAARREIEAGTGMGLLEIRDELLGDAAVLAMYQSRGAPPDDARGVLLLRPRDPDRLARLVDAVNRADARILRRLGTRSHRGVPFTMREFRGGTKPDEWYAMLDGPVLAWSNSEALIRAVIDRHEEASLPSLRRLAAFEKVRRALPDRSVLGLYANARFLEDQLAAAPEPAREGDRRMASAIRQYARSVDYAGIALEWSDGPRVHLHQEIDPARIAPSMRAWADRGGSTEGLLRGMPSNPVVLIAGNLHVPPILGGLKMLMDPRDWSRLELLAQATTGVEPDRLWALMGAIGPAFALGVEAENGGTRGFVGGVGELGPAIDGESKVISVMPRSAPALDSLRVEARGVSPSGSSARSGTAWR